MTDKGRDEFCCCNGCQCKPQPSALNFINGSPEMVAAQTAWRRFCCSCVPRFACLTVINNGETYNYDYKLHYPPSDPPQNLDQALYVPKDFDTIYIGNSQTIDLNIHFKIIDDKCYLSIVSEDLGITLDDHYYNKLIDADARGGPDYFCKTLSMDGLGYTSFIINGDLEFRLSRADDLPIAGRRSCVNEFGQIIQDDSPLRNLCCNCSCICNCFRLDYGGTMLFLDDNGNIANDETAIQATACFGEYNNGCTATWNFPRGVSLEIKSQHDKCILENLISCWKLDETSGTRVDSYGNNDLTENGVVLSGAGKVSNAASFNGTNNNLIFFDDEPIERLRLANSDGAILLWCKLDNIISDGAIISKWTDDPNDSSYELYFDSATNKFVFRIATDISTYSVSSTYSGGILSSTWYMIYAEIDNVEKKIAIKVGDMVPVTQSFSGTLQDVSPNLYIGRSGSTTSPRYFSGLIDQVLIWDKVLYKSEIGCCTNITTGITYPPADPGGSGIEEVPEDGPGPTPPSQPADLTAYENRLDQLSTYLDQNFGADSADIITCSQNNTCYAYLHTGDLNIIGAPSPIALGNDLTNTNCPHPVLSWTLMHAADEIISDPYEVTFTFRCQRCDIPTISLGSCCYSGRTNFPTTLTAEITSNCSGCDPIAIMLVWKDSNQYYEGKGEMCGIEITIQVGCPFDEAGIFFGADSGSISGGSCEPILISGSMTAFAVGSCPSNPMVNNILGITIYE